MGFTVPQRIVLICLFLFCTGAVSETINQNTLMNIVKNFESKLSGMGQYAVAFRVKKENCQNPNYNGQELITRQVRETLEKNEVYYSRNDLIAARADKNIQDHSEYRIRNYLKNVLNVKKQCVVYFTVNSPCLDKCISDEWQFNIKGNLKSLEKYDGIKAFAFKHVWGPDQRQNVLNTLKTIAPNLPYYQCQENRAECERL